MGEYNFKDDLVVAQKIEARVISHLMEKTPEMLFHGFSNYKGYDCHFSLNNKYYKLEIKSDYHATHTGNIVIEFESRGVPSGISTTQANLIAYAVVTTRGLDIYIITTKKLKALIQEKRYKNITTGGDAGSNTKMYLFSLSVFEKHCKKFEENLKGA